VYFIGSIYWLSSGIVSGGEHADNLINRKMFAVVPIHVIGGGTLGDIIKVLER